MISNGLSDQLLEENTIPGAGEIWYSSAMENKKASPIRYYPAFLDLRGKHCVVVGAGEVALRKIRMLLDCGAKVTVVSPTACREVSRLAKAGALDLRRRSYRRGDLKSAVVVVSATNRRKINQAVVEEARRRGILINVVDDPGRSILSSRPSFAGRLDDCGLYVGDEPGPGKKDQDEAGSRLWSAVWFAAGAG